MTADFLAVRLDGRLLGIPAAHVREVVRLPEVTRIPTAPPMIAGIMNLRGQLITAIDLRARLGLPPLAHGDAMGIVTEHDGHLYALVVDSVGDVVGARPDRQEAPPPTLAPEWRAVSIAVQRDDPLVLILNVAAILTPQALPEAA